MPQVKTLYSDLIDAETQAFIEETNAWYPPDAVGLSIEEQRRIYDSMCRQFFAGYPNGVTAHDQLIEGNSNAVPIRNYQMQDATPQARVVYFHGGGFVVGGLESHDDICAEICARTGYPVTSVDYRLAPENPYPADFQDAMTGFSHVAAHSDVPVILVGDSAGANLAAAVCGAFRGKPKQPAGQVLIYPGLGGDGTKGSYIDHANAPMLTTKDVEFYKTLRCGGNNSLSLEPSFAPLRGGDYSALPPTVIFSAQCDPLCDDGMDYCNALIAAQGRAACTVEPGLVHGYLRARHTVKRAADSFTRIISTISALGAGRWPT